MRAAAGHRAVCGPYQVAPGWSEAVVDLGLPKLLYPARLSLKMKTMIKSFPNKKKPKEFITLKSVLQEMLEGAF